MTPTPAARVLAAAALLAAWTCGASAADAAGLRADADIPATNPSLSPPALQDRLAKGGLVIYMRHERTTVEPVERHATVPLPVCDKSNTLTRASGERALANRTAIQHMKLPIGKVFSSPYCRTHETARLMFGGEPVLTPMLASVHATSARGAAQMRADALALIEREAQPGHNLVLVGHREGIAALTGIDINTGDALVLQPMAGAEPKVIGHVSALRWVQLGADALRRQSMASGQ